MRAATFSQQLAAREGAAIEREKGLQLREDDRARAQDDWEAGCSKLQEQLSEQAVS